MIYANVIFGTRTGKETEQLKNAAESYLASLHHAGQLCGEHFLTWFNGRLNAHVLLAGRNAMQPRYHSPYGRRCLKQLIKLCGTEPVWRIRDGSANRPTPSLRGAPFLYLFTHAFDWASPVCRGDGKPPVPVFTLPIAFESKQQLRAWRCNYYHLDNIWIASGALEIAAYRQLADPASELAEQGRALCREIETATGLPTFYYLMRYWARPAGEDQRLCPGCGRSWKTEIESHEPGQFWQFEFKCDRCKLVSHLGVSTDGGRHTRIGEFNPKKNGLKLRP